MPDSDGQITSDHGFDFERDAERLRPLVAELKAMGCRVSLFVDAGNPLLEQAAEVELRTASSCIPGPMRRRMRLVMPTRCWRCSPLLLDERRLSAWASMLATTCRRTTSASSWPTCRGAGGVDRPRADRRSAVRRAGCHRARVPGAALMHCSRA